MAKKRGLYRLRKVWGRIVPLANYVLMTVRPVNEVWVHHSVTNMPAEYFDAISKERHSKDRAQRQQWRRVAVKMEKAHVKYLEQIALGRGFTGISYTDVVFPSGRVYVGRGFQRVGAHTADRNSVSYGIVLVGNYEIQTPTPEALSGVGRTIKRGRKWHKISKTSSIDGHQNAPGAATACPGTHVMSKLGVIRREAA